MQLKELAVRIEKLVQENRRLKLAGGAVVAVLLVVALVGAYIAPGYLLQKYFHTNWGTDR